jgi:hypothetical protein
MKKNPASLAAERTRINRRQYRSANPVILFKSIISLLFSGPALMEEPGAGRPLRKIR